MSLVIGVVRESAEGEHRVAVTPDGVKRLRLAGSEVVVCQDAGAAAWSPDATYVAAGARIAGKQQVYEQAGVLVCIQPPSAEDRALLRPGQVLVGMLAPLIDPALAQELAAAKVTAISLDGLPRTLSRAQSMDALTSQANVAGYKAGLVAADAYAGYFPMFMTAAGTMRPARVLVIGAGVAGLQAIGTARRLGAVVSGYDIRDAARADVLSTGAAFLDLDTKVKASGDGGYARELTQEERQAQQDALNAAISKFDVIITTAQVPGRRPPVLVSRAALAAMKAGSVIVDIAASELGGNVEGSVCDETVVTANGVTIIGAGNLPSTVPKAASMAYSRNIAALLKHLITDDAFALDPDDAIVAGVLVTHDGEVVHPAVRQLLSGVKTDSPSKKEGNG